MSMTQTLQRALELTDSVHEAIQAGDWLRASELEQERRAAIEAYALALGAGQAEGGAAEPTADAQAALELLQDRSLRMIGEAHHHRRRLLREAATVETQRAAAAAYADT